MSSIDFIILYHLTDSLIAESFSCQIPVYPLHFPLIRARRVKPLFPQEPPYRGSFAALIITCFKGIVDHFRRHSFLQELRPDLFERDNVFTRFISAFYKFDTNTNVCPSLHVIGSFAVLFCAWHSELFSTPKWRAAFLSAAIIISLSTVFLKQHSILDVLAAIPICALGYIVVYRDKIGTSPNREK